MHELKNALERNIDNIDVDTMRELMDMLKGISEREASIELQLEEMGGLLQKNQVLVTRKEIDAVDDLCLLWKEVLKLATKLRVGLKNDLIVSVKVWWTHVFTSVRKHVCFRRSPMTRSSSAPSSSSTARWCLASQRSMHLSD